MESLALNFTGVVPGYGGLYPQQYPQGRAAFTCLHKNKYYGHINTLRNGTVCFSVSSSCSITSNTIFQWYSVQPFKKDHLQLNWSKYFNHSSFLPPHSKYSYSFYVCVAAERFPKASLLVAQAHREQALTFHPFPDQEADYCTAASSQVTRLDWWKNGSSDPSPSL